MDNRHLWLRSSRQWAIMRIRAAIIRAIRDWLDDHGYLLVDTPILTPAAGENTTTLFRDRLLRGTGLPGPDRAALQRGQHGRPRQGLLLRADLPAEKSKTRRHLMNSGWWSRKWPSSTWTP
jgi:asparaginyl-tRNA synthetase